MDGVNFIRIIRIQGKGGNDREAAYAFDENEVKVVQYYHLKYVDENGQYTYNNILRVNHDDVTNTKVFFSNRITTMLALRIIDMDAKDPSIKIIDNSGRQIRTQNVKINRGKNSLNINTGQFHQGSIN